MGVRWLTHAKTIDLQMILEEVDTSHFTKRSQMSKCHHLADSENMTFYGWVMVGSDTAPGKLVVSKDLQVLTLTHASTSVYTNIQAQNIYNHNLQTFKHNNCTKVAPKNQ